MALFDGSYKQAIIVITLIIGAKNRRIIWMHSIIIQTKMKGVIVQYGHPPIVFLKI